MPKQFLQFPLNLQGISAKAIALVESHWLHTPNDDEIVGRKLGFRVVAILTLGYTQWY